MIANSRTKVKRGSRTVVEIDSMLDNYILVILINHYLPFILIRTLNI
jgi:hypothetical protein